MTKSGPRAELEENTEFLVEAATMERSEDLNRIFNLAQDLMGVATIDGRFVTLNPAFEQLFGLPLNELIGGNLFDFLHPDDIEATRQAMAVLKEGRDVHDFVNRQRCRDGTYRFLEWRVTPFRGEFICALGRDITNKKRIEDALRISEERFRSIVEASPMAMYLYQLSDEGRLILIGANPAADLETGINHASLQGKTLEEAFPNLAGTDIPEIYRQVARGDLDTRSFVIRYDDERISGHFDVRVFRTGPGTIAVAFADISERIQTEEALKQAREELEDRVQRRTMQLHERTLQLRALASELTMAEERERQRIAGLIHDDLQQTLVAASLNCRMLLAKLGDGETAAEVERIGGMLKDSIATSRTLTAELSPPVLQQCGLAAALNWLKTRSRDQYGLEVDLITGDDVDPGLEIGVILLRSVRELLLNVVKHSRVKSACVHLRRLREDGVEITVSDSGSGFDPVEARAREGAHGGFGLFSIRERLELLGGSFEIESSPEKGSRFTLRVPLDTKPDDPLAKIRRNQDALTIMDDNAPVESHGGHPPDKRHFPRPIRIIVADDHPAVRDSLVKMMHAETDIQVVAQASDGAEALEMARLLRPDFVLMDINMPLMDGINATARIRSSIPCVQVLGLSTHADDEYRKAMMRAGAVDLLPKSSLVSEIVARLRNSGLVTGCPFYQA